MPKTELHQAAEHDDAERIKELLSTEEGRKMLEQQDETKLGKIGPLSCQNLTPLQLAVVLGKPAAVSALIAGGANVNATNCQCAGASVFDCFGCSPLHFAATRGDSGILEELLRAGADMKADVAHAGTPLHVAVGMNRTENVQLMIASGADVNACTSDSLTALHVAATLGDEPEIIQSLIRAGARVDANDFKQVGHPLHGAASMGNTAAVRALIDGGADVHALNHESMSALALAVIQSGSCETVSALVTAGADPNVCVQSPTKLTLMHLAAQTGQAAWIEALASVEGSVSEKDAEGNTPLYYALEEKHLPAITALVCHGAEIERECRKLPLELTGAVKAAHQEGLRQRYIMKKHRLEMDALKSTVQALQAEIASLKEQLKSQSAPAADLPSNT